mgnify:CR=1 FL=1
MPRWSLLPLLLIAAPLFAEPKQEQSAVPAALNFEVKSIDGQPVKLADYQGQVLLVVNVASECGATPQYSGLQSLYDQYRDQGLLVLGFPCNQFGSQEPGSEADIKAFCKREYSVTFPMFGKIEVNGDKAHAFYKHLTAQETKPKGQGKVGWNFEKFLINRQGEVVARFPTGTEPTDEQLTKAIEQALAK